MEKDALNCTASEIFKNDYITVEIPLTGKNLPTVFKDFVVECITQDAGRDILNDDELFTELLENGSVDTTLRGGELFLSLQIGADGKFSGRTTLIYAHYDEDNQKPPISRVSRKVRYFENTYGYGDLYRKKALRVLKRRITKGLKQFAKISDK